MTNQEQLGEIMEKIKAIKSKIGKVREGVKGLRADELKDAPEIITPDRPIVDATGSSQKIYDLTGGYGSLMEQYQSSYAKQQESLAKVQGELSGAREEKEKWWEVWKKEKEARPSVESKLEEERERWGLPEMYEQMQGLAPDIIALRDRMVEMDKEEAALKEKEYGSAMPQATYTGRVNRIAREFAVRKAGVSAELGAKAMAMEVYRGNITAARGLIAETVNAMTYDLEQKRQDYSDVMEHYSDHIRGLEQTEQNLFSYQQERLDLQLKIAREDKTNLMNLMIENPQAGIATSDTIEQAVAKVAAQAPTPELLSVAEAKREKVAKDKKVPSPTDRSPVVGATITPEQLSPLAKSIYDGTIGLKDITPTQRGKIAPELNAVGYTSIIDAQTKQDVNFITTEMDNVMKSWKDVPNKYKGMIQGRWAEWTKAGERNPDVAEFNSAVGIVGMSLTRLFEKGRISDEDRTFYLSLMPNLRQQSSKVAWSGTNEIKRLLKAKLVSQVNELETGNVEASQQDKDYIEFLGY